MRKIGIGLTAALFIAAVAAPALASKPATPSSGLEGDHKVTICHATSSDTNPWLVITVDIASSGGRNKLMGHLEHANDPNKQGGRGDAIPPFTYPGFDPFPGVGLNQVGLPVACGGVATATLYVIKVIDGGGAPGQFTIDVTGTNPSPASFPGAADPGTKVTLGAGAYSVDEQDPGPLWGVQYSDDCDGTIAINEIKVCTVTNIPSA